MNLPSEREQHGGGSDESEVPAQAEHDQRTKEVMQIHASQRDDGAPCQQNEPRGDDQIFTETSDEKTGEKTWRKHGDQMPLHPECSVGLAVIVANHGKWGSGW